MTRTTRRLRILGFGVSGLGLSILGFVLGGCLEVLSYIAGILNGIGLALAFTPVPGERE